MTDTLYIIGNGFDLHHELHTSYKDFRDNYAIKKQGLWQLLKVMYGERIKKDIWWCDFEEMLGRINYSSIIKSRNGNVLGPNEVRNWLQNNISVFFGEWIKSINTNIKPDTSLPLNKEALYFTFNYTLVLENVYDIYGDHIWHIHNSVNDFRNGNKPIVGHDLDYRQLIKLKKENSEMNFNDYRLMDDAIIAGSKKVLNRIALNDERFYQYSDIKHYLSMGFSFNDIDMPYIKKIISVNHYLSDCDWTVYWHSNKEFICVKDKLIDLGINANQINLIKW